MKRLLIGISLAMAALPAAALGTGKGAVLDPVKCADLAKEVEEGKGRLDVVVFDHANGQLVWPAPAKLTVSDEGIFVVVFIGTDPTKFDYSIKSLDGEESKTVDLKADGQGVETPDGKTICVSWQHHEEFAAYRVSITRRADVKAKTKGENKGGSTKDLTQAINKLAPPFSEMHTELEEQVDALDEAMSTESVDDDARVVGEMEDILRNEDPAKSKPVIEAAHEALAANEAANESEKRLLFPYTFPIWVETSGPQLSFSTGLGFGSSDLTNPRFFIKTDDHGTKGTDDDTQTIERDRNGKNVFRPDLMAYARCRL